MDDDDDGLLTPNVIENASNISPLNMILAFGRRQMLNKY